MTDKATEQAAIAYRKGRYHFEGAMPQYVYADVDAAFVAGAEWQYGRDAAAAFATDTAFQDEIRDALGTLGEGMAEVLQLSRGLQDRYHEQERAALRGADRGVALLGAIKDVGEKVEACMAIANNTEEGLAVAIDKLDKLGVEKWREAIKHVEDEATTEPMHAEVKSQPADYGDLTDHMYGSSGLGKVWANVPVNLEDVSDQTLHELVRSGQISEARYFEEFMRRHGIKRDPGYGPRKDADKITIGKPATVRDVLTAIEAVAELASAVGVRLDWRVTVGAI